MKHSRPKNSTSSWRLSCFSSISKAFWSHPSAKICRIAQFYFIHFERVVSYWKRALVYFLFTISESSSCPSSKRHSPWKRRSVGSRNRIITRNSAFPLVTLVTLINGFRSDGTPNVAAEVKAAVCLYVCLHIYVSAVGGRKGVWIFDLCKCLFSTN